MTTKGGNEILGLILHFDPDIAGSGSTITSTNLGDPNQNGTQKTSYTITKRVKSVRMVEDNGQESIVLTFKDGTKTAYGVNNSWATETTFWELPVCGNFIGLRCNFKQNNDPVVNKLGCCEIYDDLPVTYYNIFTEIASFTYTLYQGSVSKTWESTELGCYNELFTVTFVKGGVTIPKPSFITFDSATRTFAVSTTNKIDIGVYTVTLRGTLQNLTNPNTGSPWYDEFTFTLTVQSDCVNTSLTDKTINNMTLSIGSSNTQDATFADSIATTRGVTDYCGARTYTFTPSKAFLTVINGQTLQVQSNDVNDVGPYNFSMEVKLTDFPAIKITKTFTVTVTCMVSTLTFSPSPPASTTIEVGIDNQPFTMNYAVTKSPNCAQNPTWSMSPSLSFVTKAENAGNLSGVITINNATLSNVSSNLMTLTAAVDAQTATASFYVIIKDPCSRAVFQTSPAPLTNMTVTMPSAATTTQTVTIKTDIQNAKPAIVCGIQGTLTPSSTFVSLSGDSRTISVNAANISLPTDIGTKTFTLSVDSLLYGSSVTDQTYTFDVIVECTVSSLTISTKPADTNYILNQGAHTTTALSITQSSACNFAFTHTHAFTKDGASITQPTWISFTSNKFTFTITAVADIGTYTVTTTSTIPQVDPATPGVNRIITSSFNIVVVSDCTIATITDRAINDMTQGVTVAAITQDVFFWDNKSGGDKNYCGPRTYSLSPVKNFLSISGDTMSLQTDSELDINPYTIEITVSLTNYPLVQSITKSFTVTITCGVQTISFSAPLIPALTTLQVGIDSQPLSLPFATTQFPNCGNTVTFSLSPNTDPFMFIATNTIQTGELTVNGATIAQHNTYSYTLTASVNGQTATANFSIFIKDPCSSSTFQTSPNPLAGMSIVMYYQTTETKTQTIKILTDVEVANSSVVCPITAVLSLVKPYISVSSDSSSIILDGSQASDANVGQQNVTLTVNNKIFPALVAPATFTFVLDIKACEVSDFVFAQSINSITYRITDSPLTTSAYLATQATLACNFPITYTQTYQRSGATIAQPTFLAHYINTRKFSIQTSSKSDIGVYTVNVKASIPQVLLAGGTKEISFTFVVTVETDCKNTQISSINDRVVTDMLTTVNTPSTQDVTFTNTRAVFHNDINHCENYTLVLNPAHSFLKITGNVMTLNTSLVSDIGEYLITLTVSLTQFPEVTPIVKNFKVKIICEILGYTVIQALPAHSTYTIQIEPFLILSYLVKNNQGCPMTFTVEPEIRPYSLTVDTLRSQIIFETRDLHHSGVYPLKLNIVPALGSIGLTKVLNFTVELINICKTTSFDKIKIPSIEILRQDPNFIQDHYIDFGQLKTKAEKLGVDCGKVKHQIQNKNSKDSIPSWIKVDEANKKHVVNVSKEEKSYFTQSFNHHTELEEYPQIAFDQPFNVTLSSAGFSCLSNSESTFITGDPPMQFGIQFTNNTFVKDMVLTPIVSPVAFNSNEAEISLPAFVAFDKKTLQFKITDPPYETIDKYRFGINLGYKEYPLGTVTCSKTIDIKYETKFTGQVPQIISIECEQKKYSINLPQFKDVFGKKALAEMNLDEVQNFLEYDQTPQRLSTIVESAELCTYEGKYKSVLKLTDSVGFSKEMIVEIFVIKQAKQKPKAVESTYVPVFKLPPPKPLIKYVDFQGRVRVEFTRPIVLPTFAQYPEFNDGKFLRQNCTNGSEDDCGDKKQRSLAEKTPEQILKEALTIVNKGVLKVNRETYPVLDLQMVPGGDESDLSKLKFQWECVDFKEKWMDFQLNYSYEDDVSIHQKKDLLQVNFIGKEYFKSEDGQMFEESVVMQRKEVPQQIDPALGKAMESVAKSVESSSKAIAFGNLLMNFVLGGVLQELFAVMTKLQIMLHLLIVNVQIPPQTLIFFKGLLGMVTFQLIDLSPYVTRLFRLEDDASELVNYNLEYLGYSSTYFVINMGNIILMLLVNFCVIIFIGIAQKCQNQKIQKAKNKMKNIFIWNGIYKGFSEPYVVYCISCFTQLISLKWEQNGQRINNIIMLLYLVLIVLLPLWQSLLLIRNKRNLNTKEFKEKYISVYEQLNYKDGGNWTLLEPSVSSLRMLLTCAALLFLQNHRVFQLDIALFLHYVVIIYNGQVSPFSDRMFAFFQNFNEVFVFLTIMNLYCFADLIVGPNSVFYFNIMGYVLMVIVSINLAINFGYIMGKSIKQSCKKWRIKYLLWKRKKLKQILADREAKLEAEKLKLAQAKEPLSPRSLRLWHQLRKELGMSYQSQFIEEEGSFEFNSEADLIRVPQRKNDSLILDNKNRQPNDRQLLQINEESEIISEIPAVTRGRAMQKKDPWEGLRDQYVMSKTVQKRMDRFYSDKVHTKSNSPNEDQDSVDQSLSQLVSYQERHKAENLRKRSNEVFLIDDLRLTNNDNLLKPNQNYRAQPQDDQLWGTPGFIRIQELPYVQPAAERDDANSHSSRVQKRQKEARLAYDSASHAKFLFDQLWKSKNEANADHMKPNDPVMEKGFISIKTTKGKQSTGYFNENDQWGSPEHIRK